MKTIVHALLALSIIFLPLDALAMEGVARVMLVEGDVQMRMADSKDWVPTAVNTPLLEGDSLWSPAGSRVEIQLQDGTYIRLGSQSSLDILDTSENTLQFHIGMGRAYIRTGAMEAVNYQFDLTESTVRISDKARIRLDITADGDEDVSVIKGTAYVEGYGSRTRVRTGEMMSMEDSRSEILPLNAPDAWETWNRERDRTLAASAGSSGNLPEELAVYEGEMANSGQWVTVSEYGRVWRPTVIVTNDWAPYRVGRWVWRGDDYVWISHESWGWVPYHYGRWVVVPRWGWCWVPPIRGDVFWSPAYVGWVTTPGYVGWVPLAPGEIYYGHGYHGRASVNITNVTNINAGRVDYRNRRAAGNALTVVRRNSFATGRMKFVKPKGNVMAQSRVSVNRPQPPAAREIRMPLIKRIPPAKLPPPKVANVPVRELRQQLPRLDRAAGVPAAGATVKGSPVQQRTLRHDLSTQQPVEPRPQPARPARQPGNRSPAVGMPPQGAPSPSPSAVPRNNSNRGQAIGKRVPRNVWKVRPKEEAPQNKPGQALQNKPKGQLQPKRPDRQPRERKE